MIDDDFESVFRKMVEHIMETFGQFPEGQGTIRSWTGSFVNEPFEQDFESANKETDIEKIELEDSVLFLIQGQFESEPEVQVKGQKITVVGSNLEMDVDFPVDLERSKVSYRNGVLEITAFRAEVESESEGYLKIE